MVADLESDKCQVRVLDPGDILSEINSRTCLEFKSLDVPALLHRGAVAAATAASAAAVVVIALLRSPPESFTNFLSGSVEPVVPFGQRPNAR